MGPGRIKLCCQVSAEGGRKRCRECERWLVPCRGLAPMERFRAKYAVDASGCWLWTGGTNGVGYGRFYYDGRVMYAHRAAYLMMVGDIPEGRELDHLCRVRHCVNPAHLEAVSHAENTRRGEAPRIVLARANRCARGHEFDEANTYVTPEGLRRCRRCQADRAQRKRAAMPREEYLAVKRAEYARNAEAERERARRRRAAQP